MINGNEVRLEHSPQQLPTDKPVKSIKGNEVKLEQLTQAPFKFVPGEILIKGKEVKLVQLCQAPVRLVDTE